MFYVKPGDTTGYRTIKQAARAVAGYVTPESGYWPIFRKVTSKPDPFCFEVAAYVKHNGERRYFERIDRNGYDMPRTWTAID